MYDRYNAMSRIGSLRWNSKSYISIGAAPGVIAMVAFSIVVCDFSCSVKKYHEHKRKVFSVHAVG